MTTRQPLIGFHGGIGQGTTGISDRHFFPILREGTPIVYKSVGAVGPALDAITKAAEYGLDGESFVVFRPKFATVTDDNPAYAGASSPDPIAEAAQNATRFFDEKIRPILLQNDMQQIKNNVWVELINEADRNKWEQVCTWAITLTGLVWDMGFKAIMLGCNQGTPEPEHWRGPKAIELIRLASNNRDRMALSFHEGKVSYDVDAPVSDTQFDICGRFLEVFRVADEIGVPRPMFTISELGWHYRTMASAPQCYTDVVDWAEFYGAYPEFLGGFLWCLQSGPEWPNLPNQLKSLMFDWLTDYTIEETIEVGDSPPTPDPPDGHRGAPRVQYSRTYVLLPPGYGEDWVDAVIRATWDDSRYTVGGSADDAGIGDLDNRQVIAVNPDEWGPGEDGRGLTGFYDTYYPGVVVDVVEADTPSDLFYIMSGQNPPPPPPDPDPTPPVYTGPVVGDFVRGVDQPASDWYWPTGKAVFDQTGLAVKFHTGGNNPQWWAPYKHPEFNPVRVLLNPSFSGDANLIFQEISGDVNSFYSLGARDFILLNEPNIEGMGIRWNNGAEFGLVFKVLVSIFLGSFPGTRVWFPGCSPGFGAQHTFIDAAKSVGAFNNVYGVTEHVYTGVVNSAEAAALEMYNEIVDFRSRHALDRPLVIGEFSVNRPASAAYKAEVYNLLWDMLDGMDGVQGAYSFTSTWHPNPDANQEGWLESGIHNII